MKAQTFTLLDFIVLNGYTLYSKEKDKIKASFFKDSKWNEIDPIFIPFKRVGYLEIINDTSANSKFELLKKSHITEIDTLCLKKFQSQDFEKDTFNNEFNFKIRCLSTLDTKLDLLSDLALNNISKINFSSIDLLNLSNWNL